MLIVALRLAGAQALGKMSAYDLVITITLGSIVATIPLGTGISLADGVAVVVTYLGLQRLVRRILSAAPHLQRIAKNPSRVIVWDGVPQEDQLRVVDVTVNEVRAAVRKAGYGTLDDVHTVVLENDGEFSVIGRSQSGDLSALSDVQPPHCGTSRA
jgi:uncharacterized membrane protein YcaP (DUF421 family)